MLFKESIMPPVIKTDKEDIINAVMRIIAEKGHAAVSARSVADSIGISTQPIYREFGDMGAVLAAAEKRGWELFTEYVSGDALTCAERYVMFASENKGLFEFLFGSRGYEYGGLDDVARKLVSEDIIDKLESITKLPRDKVYRLHLCVWMMLHGLAELSAHNSVTLAAGDVSALVKEVTSALTAYYVKNAL